MINTPQQANFQRNKVLFSGDGQDGAATLHAKHPEEFEYYAIAFELLDSRNEREMFLLFPVMPDSINDSEKSINSVQKTAGGVVITNNSTFVPFPIRLSGSFGRKFRLVSGLEDNVKTNFQTDYFGTAVYVPGNSMSNMTVSNRKDDKFSHLVKSGYGLTKLLRKMYRASFKLDDNGGMRKLLYYNLALNEAYVIEPEGLDLYQNREMNMIWSYNLSFQAVAPVNKLSTYYRGRLHYITQQDAINKKANQVTRQIDRILGDQEKLDTVTMVNDKKVDDIMGESRRTNSSNTTNQQTYFNSSSNRLMA